MGYQFIHVNYYSRVASKKSSSKKSISDVLSEVRRVPSHSLHVAKPAAPKLLLGSLESIESDVETYAASVVDGLGRKLRKDGLCLLAGVVSVPDDLPEVEWKYYKKAAIEFLKNEYKDCLKAVIEHDDEAHRHIHFYAIPRLKEPFDSICCGRNAQRLAAVANEIKSVQTKAYCDAMRDFQKRFHRRVSKSFGLSRFGPRRRRLTRAAWRIEQQKAKEDAEYAKNLLVQLNKEKEAANKAFAIAKKAVNLYEKFKLKHSPPFA